MDPKFVNLLIQQLLNTTTCPKCGSMITPLNVKVENVGQNNCLFKMQCANCKTIISADAQMSKIQKNSEKQTTTSDQVKNNPTTQKPVVSLDDLMLIKKQLQNFPGSFNSLFQ